MPNSKATKALQKRSDSAVAAFHAHYSSEGNWGEDRWHNSLYPALAGSTRYCALVNQYASLEGTNKVFASAETPDTDLQNILAPKAELGTSATQGNVVCLQKTILNNDGSKVDRQDGMFPAPKPAESKQGKLNLFTHWNLDAASVLPALLLDVQPGHNVLDLCAAPGGKSVILAQLLWPELHARYVHDNLTLITKQRSNSYLHSNEADKNRYKRLVANLRSYLPGQLFETNAVKIINIDGSSKSAAEELPLGNNGYDRVLVDAPCSSERHVIQAHLKAASAGQVADEMSNWKSSHSKSLAKVQVSLLMTALKALKVDGRLVYATCSLATEENDSVIERTLEAVKKERMRTSSKSSSWIVNIVNPLSSTAEENIATRNSTIDQSLFQSMTESTRYGWIALPDHPSGGRWGPLYLCVLEKKLYKRKKKTPQIEDARDAAEADQ